MAIVENRSSEIGDVLRISTNVPVIGVVSLYSFLDNTEGEYPGSSSSQISPFEDSRRRGNDLFSLCVVGDNIYASAYSVTGSIYRKGLVVYNKVSQSWDVNLPDSSRPMIGIIENSGHIYAATSTFNEINDTYSLSIEKFDTALKTWADVVVDAVIGDKYINKGAASQKVFSVKAATELLDGKMVVRLGRKLVLFDISTEIFTTNNDLTNITTGIAIDSTNEIAYLPVSINDLTPLKVNTMVIYDYQTNSFLGNTSKISQADGGIRNCIYSNNSVYITYRDSSLSSGYADLMAYFNPLSNSWTKLTETLPFGSINGMSPDGPNFIGHKDYIYSFDTSINEWGTISTPSKFFSKQFRYSSDGGNNFTEWSELSSINIQNINVSRKDLFIVEYKYERIGEDATGELAWNSTTLNGEINPLLYPIYEKSIFNKFFDVNDVNVLGWALNVLEKLYQKGILPDYIDRAEDEHNPIDSDKDLLSFFGTITHFFAIIVYYARQFRDLKGNKILTREFILSRGVVAPFDENLEDMIYILDNYVTEYRNRGTEEVFKGVEDGRDIDGELLRLINYISNNEFIFALLESKDVGWCIGESSPTWSNTSRIVNMNKNYEKSKFIVDINNYPLIESSYVSTEEIDTGINGVGNCLKISGVFGSGVLSGIGSDNPVDSDFIKVDPNLDYEVSFKVKTTVGDIGHFVSFSLDSFNSNKEVNSSSSLINLETGLLTNFICEGADLKTDKFYLFKGVIFNKDKALTSSIKPFIEDGNSLKFGQNTTFIIPRIIFDDYTSEDCSYYIYDIKIKPINLPFTQGQLGVKNVIASYMKNNGGFSENEIYDFIKRYLISYKNYLKIKFI